MHFYQFNIADFRKKAHYLNHTEKGIYRDLIDTYYLNEGPLCIDHATLMRTHGIRTDDEKVAFEAVLSDFFVLKDDGYHLERCDEELAKIYEKSEKARQSAKKRWENNQKDAGDQKVDANGMRTHSEGNATHNPLPNTHNPIYTYVEVDPKNDEVNQGGADSHSSPQTESSSTVQSAAKHPSCPHDRIVELYHEILPELTRVNTKLWKGSTRAKDLTTRWRQCKEHQDEEFWQWYFNGVRTLSDGFYLGSGNRGWKADLGWLLKKKNFESIVEKILEASC